MNVIEPTGTAHRIRAAARVEAGAERGESHRVRASGATHRASNLYDTLGATWEPSAAALSGGAGAEYPYSSAADSYSWVHPDEVVYEPDSAHRPPSRPPSSSGRGSAWRVQPAAEPARPRSQRRASHDDSDAVRSDATGARPSLSVRDARRGDPLLDLPAPEAVPRGSAVEAVVAHRRRLSGRRVTHSDGAPARGSAAGTPADDAQAADASVAGRVGVGAVRLDSAERERHRGSRRSPPRRDAAAEAGASASGPRGDGRHERRRRDDHSRHRSDARGGRRHRDSRADSSDSGSSGSRGGGGGGHRRRRHDRGRDRGRSAGTGSSSDGDGRSDSSHGRGRGARGDRPRRRGARRRRRGSSRSRSRSRSHSRSRSGSRERDADGRGGAERRGRRDHGRSGGVAARPRERGPHGVADASRTAGGERDRTRGRPAEGRARAAGDDAGHTRGGDDGVGALGRYRWARSIVITEAEAATQIQAAWRGAVVRRRVAPLVSEGVLRTHRASLAVVDALVDSLLRRWVLPEVLAEVATESSRYAAAPRRQQLAWTIYQGIEQEAVARMVRDSVRWALKQLVQQYTHSSSSGGGGGGGGAGGVGGGGAGTLASLRRNPLVQLVEGIVGDVVRGEVVATVRACVREVAQEYVEDRRAHDALERWVLVPMLRSAVVEAARELAAEAAAADLVQGVVARLVRQVASETLAAERSALRTTLMSTQREQVEAAAARRVVTRALLRHLCYTMASRAEAQAIDDQMGILLRSCMARHLLGRARAAAEARALLQRDPGVRYVYQVVCAQTALQVLVGRLSQELDEYGRAVEEEEELELRNERERSPADDEGSPAGRGARGRGV